MFSLPRHMQVLLLRTLNTLGHRNSKIIYCKAMNMFYHSLIYLWLCDKKCTGSLVAITNPQEVVHLVPKTPNKRHCPCMSSEFWQHSILDMFNSYFLQRFPHASHPSAQETGTLFSSICRSSNRSSTKRRACSKRYKIIQREHIWPTKAPCISRSSVSKGRNR